MIFMNMPNLFLIEYRDNKTEAHRQGACGKVLLRWGIKMGNTIGNIFNCPDLNRVHSRSREYLSEYFQEEEINSLNYPEILEEVLMNAAQLKLNYPEILEEIIRKVDSAVLSSKSPSILERVKCCSQSILSKKDLI